jgi:hypothetical protein
MHAISLSYLMDFSFSRKIVQKFPFSGKFLWNFGKQFCENGNFCVNFWKNKHFCKKKFRENCPIFARFSHFRENWKMHSTLKTQIIFLSQCHKLWSSVHDPTDVNVKAKSKQKWSSFREISFHENFCFHKKFRFCQNFCKNFLRKRRFLRKFENEHFRFNPNFH